MNVISKNHRPADGKQPPRQLQRTGRLLRHAGYFDKQRLGVYGTGGVSSTLSARNYKDASDLIVDQPEKKYVIRRLTPLECCRLQGFPDYWEDGVEGSDSARYKMWGNGMALPCVCYVMQGIREVLTDDRI